MNHQYKPSESDLPSSSQLFKSTIIAVLVAGILLLLVILPAEYGVDPTGVGDFLGLKKMGGIKVSLEKEAINDIKIACKQALNECRIVEVSPQPNHLRQLQHREARRLGLNSMSVGQDPHRRIRIYPKGIIQINIFLGVQKESPKS